MHPEQTFYKLYRLAKDKAAAARVVAASSFPWTGGSRPLHALNPVVQW
jgi:hypothetical protein